MKFSINTTTEQLNSTAGIILAGKIFKKIGLTSKSHYETIRSMLGLLIQGRCSFEEIELHRNDNVFKLALELPFVPAQETLRLYLEKIVKSNVDIEKQINKANLKLLKQVNITPAITESCEYIPVDIDVSPFDNSKSNKEGVNRTYKGFDGYAPIFSYIGLEGYMLDCELREGKQHCQNNTPEFLKRNIVAVDSLNLSKKALFRLDSGNDASVNIDILTKSGHFFLIKRNLRKESIEQWHERAKALGKKSSPREGKIVYTGFYTSSYPSNDRVSPYRDIVFRVTERKTDENGNPFLFPEIEVETYWTNLYETPEKVIELYHAHGTSEQFHSELKTDMNIERFPSGKMKVNSLILHLAMIALNTLRRIGQLALEKNDLLPYKHNVLRKRIRKVISDLIHVACKMVSHARQKIIYIWEKNPWLPVFKELYQSL